MKDWQQKILIPWTSKLISSKKEMNEKTNEWVLKSNTNTNNNKINNCSKQALMIAKN